MMQNDQELNELQTQIFDVFMELSSEDQQAERQAASARSLRARRGIEDHFEKKRLQRELTEFDFE
ncbi:PA3496 family putative envelope integrity protein [Motiliproteus sediminis]|uniref:PA3496 family putative envelope integrity protein n=1 Tax=Motiliproteus sediminis TaxID=1468178 RepID=UPI001AEFE4DE|nr:hypothetical protein [Motiliproteus sediminis]